jgi:hypothetical protein
MAKRVAGVCYIKVDGAQLEVAGDIEVPLAQVKRETVMGVFGPVGYKETSLEPYIKLSAVVRSDFPLATIIGNTSLTITAELANGWVYTLSDAFLTGEPSIKVSDGTVDLEFGGMKGQFQ